ncbi:MAG: MoxR family ATPase [Chloroflexi bacterium]|nr:MoxR family ATPase [Chloroflexota bacterium]
MTDAPPTLEMSIEEFSERAQAIVDQVRKVIVGQTDLIRQALICVIAGRHALLEGVPGLGKTMLIRTLAQAMNLKFARIQFTPDLMPADIVGTDILEEREDGRREFRFQAGPVFANLVLADEINRATPKTQSALLEAMQEKRVTVANQTYELEAPFFVLATQNPLEMEGTYPLPEAQLDRFMFKVDVTFPNANELVEIFNRTTGSYAAEPEPVVDAEQIIAMGELALQVPIASHVSEYVARLVVSTHPEYPDAPDMVKQYVRYGSSPRGGQALILGSKVNALLEGRYNVAFDDIRQIAAAVFRHRLLLNFEAQAEGITADQIIEDMLEKVGQEG